jgi:hypothetical protein
MTNGGALGWIQFARTTMGIGCMRRSGRVSLRIPFRLRAFRRRSESPQPLWGNDKGFRQLRVCVISVTDTCENRAEFQCLTPGLTSHHA